MEIATDNLLVHSLAELSAFAERFTAGLKPGDCIGVQGDLGAGKTTFVKACGAAFGIKEDITSPTYSLEHRYKGMGEVVFRHWDLYRVAKAPAELIEDLSTSITFIEWWERDAELFQYLTWKVDLQVLGGETRAMLVQKLIE